MLAFLFTARADNSFDFKEFHVIKTKIVGIKSISRKKLSRYLIIKSSPRWKFWRPKLQANFTDVEDDLLQIKQFYQNAGYYHTKVTYHLERVKTGQILPSLKDLAQGNLNQVYEKEILVPAVKLIYSVSEGPPVLIRSVSIKIRPEIEEFSEETLIDLLPTKTAVIFDTAQYYQSKKTLVKAFRNNGYPNVNLDGEVTVNTDRNEAMVTFDIIPGAKCQFGKITIADNMDYIREETLYRALRFEKGETYSEAKVDGSMRNLFNLDVFKTVSFSPEEGHSDRTVIPFTLEAEPKKRQSTRLGVGYGSEDGPRVSGTWTFRNAFNWGGKLSLNAKTSKLIQKANVEFLQPYAIDSKSSLKYVAGFEREFLDSHTNRRSFAEIDLNQDINQNWSYNFGYILEINKLEDFNIDDPEEIALFRDDNNFLLSFLRFGVSRDTRNNIFAPTKGSVLALSIEHGSHLTGSEVDFFAPSFEVIHHQPVTKSITLAGRVRVESIQEIYDTTSIPIFKRLFLGGSSTVRGYGFQKLGPIDEDDDPLGGESSLSANVEIRCPIYKKLSGVVFIDMGLIKSESFSYNLQDLLYSCGLGIRYETVVGPIRLDFGYKLNPPRRGDFGITSNPNDEIEDRWKIHANIGQAF